MGSGFRARHWTSDRGRWLTSGPGATLHPAEACNLYESVSDHLTCQVTHEQYGRGPPLSPELRTVGLSVLPAWPAQCLAEGLSRGGALGPQAVGLAESRSWSRGPPVLTLLGCPVRDAPPGLGWALGFLFKMLT